MRSDPQPVSAQCSSVTSVRTDTRTRAQLLAQGMTGISIARAVHDGRLLRVRRGHYALPTDDDEMVRAVRIGGRLGCVSELRARGVWVIHDPTLHVSITPGSSRLRSPDDRHVPWDADDTARLLEPVRLHWLRLIDPRAASASHVGMLDALRQSAYCLPPEQFLAALDSAWHLRLLPLRGLRTVLTSIPDTRTLAIGRLDRAAESGIETIVRDLCRHLGLRVRIQVAFGANGRADLLVEDWIVIETDGRQFHQGETATRDRRRDAAHLAAGRLPLRFTFAQVMSDRRAVALAIIGAVRMQTRIPDAAHLARRALRRLARLHLDDPS